MVTDSGHLILAAAWTAWCAVHSLLITRGLLSWLRAHAPRLFAWSRLLYVLFSLVSLIPLLLYQRSLVSETWFAWQYPWNILQWSGIALSLAVLYAGAREYDQRTFFGIRQIRGEERGPDSAEFRMSGILGCIRHPYYTGGIVFLLFWGDLTAATFVMKVVLIAYLVLGTFLEERKLLQEHGDAYARYRARVPMFLPRLKKGC
jgi:protein-S-isoprenylcysteine O-methyltransferase Ste14